MVNTPENGVLKIVLFGAYYRHKLLSLVFSSVKEVRLELAGITYNYYPRKMRRKFLEGVAFHTEPLQKRQYDIIK